MATNQNNGGGGWFIDYGLVEEDQGSDFLWAPQIVDDPAVSSAILGFDLLHKEENYSNNTCTKRRPRMESRAAPGTKACREKMRRDRLNDRFTELCSILDPGKPPKADKVAVLSDATRLLNQLRLEAKRLQESNEALRHSIKTLKAEKAELIRDEKVKLKAQKEQMEQMVKGISIAPPFLAQPAVTVLPAASLAAYDKSISYPSYPPVGMWQWIPPTALDTSQDQLLRPPVA